MNTTYITHANAAIGLAQETNTESPATATCPAATQAAATQAARKKTLVLGLLGMASCTAAALCFKAAVLISEVLAAIDAAYKTFYT
jgi:hypothetical protein